MKNYPPLTNYYIRHKETKRILKGKPNKHYFVLPRDEHDGRWFTLSTLRLFLTTIARRWKQPTFTEWEFLEYHTAENKHKAKFVGVKTLQEVMSEEKFGEYIIKMLQQ